MKEEPIPHTIVEIGTNTGLDTQRIYELTKPCSYFAFEPNPVNIKEFNKLPLSRAIHFEGCAVGNYDGFILFNQCDCVHPVNKKRFTGASSIHKPTGRLLKKHPWIKMANTVTVPICTLDTFAAKWISKPITFIWCDAQGAEGQIIQGAQETLKRTKYFYFEYFKEEMYENCMVLDEILELLPDWYIVEQYPGDILLRNELCK